MITRDLGVRLGGGSVTSIIALSGSFSTLTCFIIILYPEAPVSGWILLLEAPGHGRDGSVDVFFLNLGELCNVIQEVLPLHTLRQEKRTL
jgi:hypothetical protein